MGISYIYFPFITLLGVKKMAMIRIGDCDYISCKITQTLLGSEYSSYTCPDNIFIKIRPDTYQEFPNIIKSLVYEQPFPEDNSIPKQRAILVDDNLVPIIMNLYIKREVVFLCISRDMNTGLSYVHSIKPFSETIKAQHI